MGELILSIQSLLTILFILHHIESIHAASIKARNLVANVAPGDEVVITLAGVTLNGSPLTATIVTLPTSGAKLHQLSHVYNTHGHEPKSNPLAILKTGEIVTGSNNRIVYKRPAIDRYPVEGRYDVFTYTVSDGVSTSKPGNVLITYDSVSTRSRFDFGVEDWTITNNKDVSPNYEPTHRGDLRNYIYSTDGRILPSHDGEDSKLWYFNAPSKFLGNHWETYGGSLRFLLSAASGDFSTSQLTKNGNADLVLLECASCNLNRGMRLVKRLDNQLTFDGNTKLFSISLVETAGWLKDPYNSIQTWTTPTKCEMYQVLSDLSALRILGDHTRRVESVALDSVELHHGKNHPIDCN